MGCSRGDTDLVRKSSHVVGIFDSTKQFGPLYTNVLLNDSVPLSYV